MKKSIKIDSNLFRPLKKSEIKSYISKAKRFGHIKSYDLRVLIEIKKNFPEKKTTLLLLPIFEEPKKFKPKTGFGKNYFINYYKHRDVLDYDQKPYWFAGYQPERFQNNLLRLIVTAGVDSYQIEKKHGSVSRGSDWAEKCLYLNIDYRSYPKSKNEKQIFRNNLLSFSDLYLLRPNDQHSIKSLRILEDVEKMLTSNKHLDRLVEANSIIKENYSDHYISPDSFSGSFIKLEKCAFSNLLFSNVSKYLESRMIQVSGQKENIEIFEECYFNKIDEMLNFKHQRRLVDEDYAKFIDGKSIAIVGPHDIAKDYKEKIHQHDVIIRINFKPEDPLIRTDVFSFLWPSINEQSILELSKSSEFCLVYNQLSRPHQGKRIRSIFVANNHFCINKLFSHVERIVYDALQFTPKKISIYGCTLGINVGNSLHGDHYRSQVANIFGLKDYRQNINKAAIRHDPIHNFMLMKHLNNKRTINFNDCGTGILDMTADQYISKFFSLKNF